MSRPKKKPIVYVLDKENNFTTKISTNTNEAKPSVVFLRAKVVITPLTNKKNYELEIANIVEKFKNKAKSILDNCNDYEKKYLLSVDVSGKSVRYKKNSHFHYDIFLKPTGKHILSEHRDKLKIISDKLDSYLIDLFEHYGLEWKKSHLDCER